MAIPSLNLRGNTHLETLQLTQEIITKMTGNANFGTPNPTLAGLQTRLTAARDAVNAYESARQALTMLLAERDQAMDDLKADLRSLAGYVASASNGDAAIILSSGMDIKQDSAPIGLPEAPRNLSAQFGANEGTCALDWQGVRGARSYMIECAADANGPWNPLPPTTEAKTVATNLVAGTRYYFRVRALGAAGLGPWSDIASKVAAYA